MSTILYIGGKSDNHLC